LVFTLTPLRIWLISNHDCIENIASRTRNTQLPGLTMAFHALRSFLASTFALIWGILCGDGAKEIITILEEVKDTEPKQKRTKEVVLTAEKCWRGFDPLIDYIHVLVWL
jgi:hypothetical protein